MRLANGNKEQNMEIQVKAIGTVKHDGNGAYIQLEAGYGAGLRGLEGFGHVQVLWWCSGCDDGESRSALRMAGPYRGAPATMGVFATRSPARPNPVGLTACEVVGVEEDEGRVRVVFIDAEDGTPVLDIKPYTPSFDRVESPRVPEWCLGWPRSTEASGCFDWGRVFQF